MTETKIEYKHRKIVDSVRLKLGLPKIDWGKKPRRTYSETVELRKLSGLCARCGRERFHGNRCKVCIERDKLNYRRKCAKKK